VLAALVRTGLTFREVRSLPETRRQAKTDDLTELGNRRFLYERLEEQISASESAGGRFGFLMIDLNRFKELNDTLGHEAGDLLLEQIGPRIRRSVRRGDTVARVGGDEFAVLLPDEGGIGQAVATANRIRSALEEPFLLRGIAVHVGASAGVAVYPDHGVTRSDLLRHSDIALSQAKTDGTGCEVYSADRDGHSIDKLALMGELHRPSQAGEIVAFFQPQAELATGRVTGIEALVRWQHPARSLLAPHEFLPLGEQTGLMPELTLRVLDIAVEQAAAWNRSGRQLRVAVNLSATNLLDLQLPADVSSALIRHGLAPERLQLEITEDTVMSDPVRAQQVLAELKVLGVGISLDDFGTGFSSLAYLKRLAVDELKIDKSFVLHMSEASDDAVIVQSTIELGRNLGLGVVAEGVEDRESWDRLAEFGCDIAQGYFLSRPVPAHDFTAWLAGWDQHVLAAPESPAPAAHPHTRRSGGQLPGLSPA
jgi:diguanylate cyclase